MPSHTLKTKIELGFLGETPVEIDYWSQGGTVEVEGVRIELAVLTSDAIGWSTENNTLEIDLDYCDCDDLEQLCLDDLERQRDREEGQREDYYEGLAEERRLEQGSSDG